MKSSVNRDENQAHENKKTSNTAVGSNGTTRGLRILVLSDSISFNKYLMLRFTI